MASAVTHILKHRAKIQRPKSFLVDKKLLAPAMTLDRQPSQSCRFEVELDGCTISNGAVVIQVAGLSETLTFSSNGLARSSGFFTQVDGLSIFGISDGLISVRGVNGMGQPIQQLATIVESAPVRFFKHEAALRYQKAGQIETGDFGLIGEPDLDVQGGDIITALYGLEKETLGRAIHIDPLFDFDGLTHHVEVKLNNIL